jgi:hypothetical protein
VAVEQQKPQLQEQQVHQVLIQQHAQVKQFTDLLVLEHLLLALQEFAKC